MNKVCGICSKNFETDNSKSKFCSKECYWNSKTLRKVKNCLRCDKEFMQKRMSQVYCSKECRYWTDRNIDKNCEVCGKVFCDPKHPNRKFCSLICSAKNQQLGPKIKNCDKCGKEFERCSWKQRFCSTECSNQSLADNNGHWTIEITPEIHEMIEGLLLSDASLEVLKSNRYPRFVLNQGTGHKEYCEYVAEKLGLTKECVKSRFSTNKNTGKTFEIHTIATGSSPILEKYYHRWYKEGKKVIPDDFKITPISLLHTYLGDGCFYINKILNKRVNKYYTNVKINIALMDFSPDSVKNIIENQLKEYNINLITRSKKQKGYDRLYTIIETGSFPECQKFFEFCDKNPIRCYDYKFMTDKQKQDFNTRNSI